jgi:hypothetical protein
VQESGRKRTAVIDRWIEAKSLLENWDASAGMYLDLPDVARRAADV